MTNYSFATTRAIEEGVRTAKAKRQALLHIIRLRRVAARRGRVLRMTQAPAPLHQRGLLLDNVALVPASLLPLKAAWQKLANELPEGDMLIVLPTSGAAQEKAYEQLARTLEAANHPV